MSVPDTTLEVPEMAGRPKGRPAKSDLGYNSVLWFVAVLFALIVVWFLWGVIDQSRPAWSTYGTSILTGTTWDPTNNLYGAVPFIVGTLESAGIAMLFAIPVGIGTALTLVFFLPRRLKAPMSSLVELLAAVPSVVYGLWGLLVIAPWFANTLQPKLQSATANIWGLKTLFSGNTLGQSILLAGLVLFVMVLPTIVAISRDVIDAVSNDLVEGGLSLGATRWTVLSRVVLPTAKVGILGAITLAAGRAIGETIAVALVIGSEPHIPHSLFDTGQTLASTIALQFDGSTAMQLSALFALATILMAMTILVNAFARYLVRRTPGVKAA